MTASGSPSTGSLTTIRPFTVGRPAAAFAGTIVSHLTPSPPRAGSAAAMACENAPSSPCRESFGGATARPAPFSRNASSTVATTSAMLMPSPATSSRVR